MSVILQFSHVRKHAPSAPSRDCDAMPVGDAEILIFPGVRIERLSSLSETAQGEGCSASVEKPVGSSSIGGTDE